MSFMEYLAKDYMNILALLWEHVQMTALAVAISILIGVPLGIFIYYHRNFQKPVIGFANIMQAVPSMALLGFAIPLLGIGKLPAIVVVIIYSLLPILKNTYTGLTQINPETREAAVGIGLSPTQLLAKVEFPLALPVIMAGVRISAVTAVGLMTIAAFIGAGGLGDLVFAGIRTVDNNQILGGAIPACLLALGVDYLLGQLEFLTVPVSTALIEKKERAIVFRLRKRAKFVLSTTLIVLLIGGGYAGYRHLAKPAANLAVGSKNFTESLVMGHMMSDIIEARTGLTVDRRMHLGGTQVAQEALHKGEIDLYLDYTGTLYVSVLKHEPSSDMEFVYRETRDEFMRDYNILILPQYSFNNTYTISVRQDFAETHNLRTISDLMPIAREMDIGCTFEFLTRPDGLQGVLDHYGFDFRNQIGIDDSARYIAIDSEEVQAINAFATDGLLKKFNLVVLEDDRSYFPPYFAVPVLRNEVAEAHPEVVDALNELGPLLTDEVMQKLNYLVDEEQQSPAQVAKNFLIEQGLIDG